MNLGFSRPYLFFEWKQQLVVDLDATPGISQKQISKSEEGVKEKIILSQEKNIQQLNELVRSLRLQLQQCRGDIEKANSTVHLHPLTKHVTRLEQQQLHEGLS
ncbi:hypothetical protein UlMin_012202 [Ulmus minor]